MPKRIVDGPGIWRSDKIRELDSLVRAEYANLIPLADSNGIFEYEPARVWSEVYSYNRPNITLEIVKAILDEFNRTGLLYVWEEKFKKWGYFVGIEKPGRLPGESRRGKNDFSHGVSPPDQYHIQQYLSSCRTTGLVYFIQGEKTKRVKIGCSRYPYERLSMHQTGSPDKLALLGVMAGGRTLESELHRKFQEHWAIGEWFEPHESIIEYITTYASMDSNGFQKLPGLGFGSGIGLGEGVGEDDMNIKNSLIDKSRAILGVRVAPTDANWGEIKALVRAYGEDAVSDKFEEWAKSQTSPPNYPLSGFVRVADALLSGKFASSVSPAELMGLVNEIAAISDGQVIFNSKQRIAIGSLLSEHSPADIKLAFQEFWGNISGDDFLVRQAAKTFTEAAEQLLFVRAKRAEDARRTSEQIRVCTENEQRVAREETEKALREVEELESLVEDTLEA